MIFKMRRKFADFCFCHRNFTEFCRNRSSSRNFPNFAGFSIFREIYRISGRFPEDFFRAPLQQQTELQLPSIFRCTFQLILIILNFNYFNTFSNNRFCFGGHLSNNRQSSNYFSVVINNRQTGL